MGLRWPWMDAVIGWRRGAPPGAGVRWVPLEGQGRGCRQRPRTLAHGATEGASGARPGTLIRATGLLGVLLEGRRPVLFEAVHRFRGGALATDHEGMPALVRRRQQLRV